MYKPKEQANRSHPQLGRGSGFVSSLLNQLSTSSADELSMYLSEAVYPRRVDDVEEDILEIWKTLEPRFPNLARMARDFLAVPGTTVGVERCFSNGGRVVTPYRSRMAPSTVEKTMELHDWMGKLPRVV